MRIKKIHVQKLWRLCYNWCRILHRDTNKLFLCPSQVKSQGEENEEEEEEGEHEEGEDDGDSINGDDS